MIYFEVYVKDWISFELFYCGGSLIEFDGINDVKINKTVSEWAVKAVKITNCCFAESHSVPWFHSSINRPKLHTINKVKTHESTKFGFFKCRSASNPKNVRKILKKLFFQKKTSHINLIFKLFSKNGKSRMTHILR